MFLCAILAKEMLSWTDVCFYCDMSRCSDVEIFLLIANENVFWSFFNLVTSLFTMNLNNSKY